MTIDNQVEDKKLQNDVNREAEKFLQNSSSGKIDIYEYLTDEEILPSNQKRKKKAFEKQAKEQVKPIKDLNVSGKTNELKQIERIFPRNLLNDLIRDKMIEILIHKTILN